MMASPSSAPHLPVRMRVAADERLHKLFIIHDPKSSPDHPLMREFRIFTKEKADGTLELLGYQYEFDGQDEHQSKVLRAPSVPRELLIGIVRRLVEQTHTDIKQMEAIDLTIYRNRLDQTDRLAQHELLEAFEFE